MGFYYVELDKVTMPVLILSFCSLSALSFELIFPEVSWSISVVKGTKFGFCFFISRNEVWRYSRAVNGPKNWQSTWGRFVFRKFHVGLGLAIAVVALEKGYDAMSGSGDHGHGGHH